MEYAAHHATFAAIYVLVATGLNFVLGYCGLLSLAQASFFALGGYGFAVATVGFHCPTIAALAIAAAVGGIFSLALSIPAWRLKGDYFVLATLAFQSLVFSTLNNWARPGDPLGTPFNMTNGSLGIAGIPRLQAFHVVPITNLAFAGVAIGITFGLMVMVNRMAESPWTRLLRAMRDDELVVRGLGKSTHRAKLEALAIGSSLAAIAGALYASYVGFLDPSAGSLDQSILFLSMLIVGGSGNVIGPVVGALLLVALPEALRFLQVPDATAGPIRLLIYGGLLIAIVHARPRGAAGVYEYR